MRIPLHNLKAMAIKAVAIFILCIAVNQHSYEQSKVHNGKRPSPVLRKAKQSLPHNPKPSTHAKHVYKPDACTNTGPYYVNDASSNGDVYTMATGDDNNCGTADAPFATIQHAIDVAAPGDSIYVDAGSYEEQLQVTGNALTIYGAGEGVTTIVSPDVLATAYTDSYGDNKPIVYVSGADLTIANLTVDGAAKGTGNYQFEGITYYNAGGNVHDCEVENINDGPENGLQDGFAINFFSDDAASRSIIVRHNNVHDFQKNGITIDGAGLSANVLNNTITGAGVIDYIAQNGLQVSGGAAATITSNTISSISYSPNTYVASGIIVYGSNAVNATSNTINDVQAGILYYQAGGAITKNILTNNASHLGATPYWYAIDAEDGTVTVSQNEIYNGGNGSGIEGDAYSGETTSMDVENNIVFNSDEGVVMFTQDDGSVTSTVHYNSITNNTTNAIHNYGSQIQDATCNWYGTNDNDAVAAKITGHVTYIPYLFSGTDVNPGVPGFQPTSSCAQPLSVVLTSKTDVDCNGDNNGAIDITVSGGSGNYSYSWSNGKTTQDIKHLTADTYTVTVTDRRYGNTAMLSVNITQPTPLTISASNKTNLTCNGDNSGSFTVNGAGGTSPYKYSFNNGAFVNNHTYNNLAAATYNVVVKDANGCTKSLNVKLTQPDPFVVSVVSHTNIRCHGNSTGIIKVSTDGGTRPYNDYSLSGPVNQSNSSGNFKNLPAGNYTITRTDAHGCTSTVMQTLTEPQSGCSNSPSVEITDSKVSPVSSLEVSLSPNPAPSQFTLNVKSNSNSAVTIRVVDMMGKTIYTTQGSANQSYQFGDHFTNGIYSVQIIQGTTIKTIKAVKGQ